MRQLRRIRPQEIPRVLQIAAELHARDRVRAEHAEQHQALIEAAAEVGLPSPYLERAAARLRARRIARIRWLRHWWNAGRIGVSMALAFWAVGNLFAPRAPMQDLLGPAASYPRARPRPIHRVGTPPPPSGTFFPVNLSRKLTLGLGDPMLNIGGNDLSSLGSGLKRLGGVPFRLDGVIMVGPGDTGAPGTAISVLRRVSGIRVGRRAERLYFLQGAHFVFPAMMNVRIGEYVVHYADGARESIPIRAGVDVADWWENGTNTTDASVAWIGSCPAAARAGTRIRLFLTTWTNPRPGIPISSLEMVTGDQPSGLKMPAPFLVAVTAARDDSPAAGSAAVMTRGNLLSNGSFEEAGLPSSSGVLPFGVITLSGWRMVRGTVDVVPGCYWQQAPDQGSQSLDLAGTPGHATIEQTFPTQPGRDYRFSGWLAHNPERQTQEGRADVFINGRRTTTLCHHDALATRIDMRWVRFSCRFRAAGKETTLRLVDVTPTSDLYGAVLDGLAVTPIAGGQG